MAYTVLIKNLKKAINPVKIYGIKSSEIKKAINDLDIFPIAGGNDKSNMIRNIAYKVLNPTDLPVTLNLGDIETGNIPENIVAEGAEELIAAMYLEKETIAVNFEGNLSTVKTFVGQSLEELTEINIQDKPVQEVDWSRGFNVEEYWDDKAYVFNRLGLKPENLFSKIDKSLWQDESFIIELLDKKEIKNDSIHLLIQKVSQDTLLSDLFFTELKTHPVAFYKLWDKFYYEKIYREPSADEIRDRMETLQLYQRNRNDAWGLPPMPRGFSQNNWEYEEIIHDFEHELESGDFFQEEENFYRKMQESLFPQKSASELHIKHLIQSEILNNVTSLKEIILHTENGYGILTHVNKSFLSHREIFDAFWQKEENNNQRGWYVNLLPKEAFKDEYILTQLFEKASFNDLENKAAFHGKWLKDNRKLEKFIGVSNNSFVGLFKELSQAQQNNASIVDAFMQRHPAVYALLPDTFKSRADYIVSYLTETKSDIYFVPAPAVFALDLQNPVSRQQILTILKQDKKGILAKKEDFPQVWLEDKELIMGYKQVLAHHPVSEAMWDDILKEKENLSDIFRSDMTIYSKMPDKYKNNSDIALAYLHASRFNQNTDYSCKDVPAVLWGSKSFCLKAIAKIGDAVANYIPKPFFREQQFLLDVTEMISKGEANVKVVANVPSINQFFAESGAARTEYYRDLKNYFSHANLSTKLNRLMPEEEEDTTPQIKI
jgi:hypothetical protein